MIQTIDLSLRYVNKQESLFEVSPHQSILGNSSILYEMPRTAAVSMAGPDIHPVYLSLIAAQVDYKDTAGTQILTIGVSSQIPLMWLFN